MITSSLICYHFVALSLTEKRAPHETVVEGHYTAICVQVC